MGEIASISQGAGIGMETRRFARSIKPGMRVVVVLGAAEEETVVNVVSAIRELRVPMTDANGNEITTADGKVRHHGSLLLFDVTVDGDSEPRPVCIERVVRIVTHENVITTQDDDVTSKVA